MIELLISLFSVAGSTGFGAFLKLVSNFLQARHEQRLSEIAGMSKAARSFQKVFAPDQQSRGALLTRRLLALHLIWLIVFIGVWSTMYPTEPFVSFILPEARNSWSFLWGLLKFPATKEVTVVLTRGHLALSSLNIAAIAVGFYFTPTGRR